MPPEPRFVCRFAAEPPQATLPHGQWADNLQAEFLAACRDIDAGEDHLGEPGSITWFPDRTWWGRTYVPATARTSTGFELFGHVSFAPGDDEREPDDFHAVADFTDDTADAHPDWKLDLSDDVVGGWRGAGETAAMTLVWGVPLLPRGATATTELGDLTVDQCEVVQDRFTLVAPASLGEDYLEVVLWDGAGEELARESVYEE